jgi:hypothetical protein
MSAFTCISPAEASLIKAGTVMFLPPCDLVPQKTYTDPNLHFGAFNHPIIILSCPEDESMTLDSKVKIAIVSPSPLFLFFFFFRKKAEHKNKQMTSFNGTPIKKHLAAKGIKHKLGSVAAQRSGYLRVVTASKPCAKDTLKLRNGRGMKRDCSYVNVKEAYDVSLKALARYGFDREEVDKYRLTAHALKVLLGEIVRWRRRGVGRL